MSSINEQARWEDEIYLLARGDRVEGGVFGPSNKQAKQLANRTQFLKSAVESVQDYREYTFFTSTGDPDGTKAGIAGTPEGKLFRVVIPDAADQPVAFVYYQNVSGKAVRLNSLASQQAIETLTKQLEQRTGDELDGLTAVQLGLQALTSALLQLGLDDLAAQVEKMAADQPLLSDQTQALMLAFQSAMRALALLESTPEDVEVNQMNNLYAVSVLARQLLALDGYDPETAQQQAREKFPGIYAFGEPAGLIRLDITSAGGAPTSKDNPLNGMLKVTIDGEVFSAFVSYKVQGASSSVYPKKNMKFELFADEGHTQNISLKIGDVVPKDKWIFKANWIDSTHIRNVMSYNLWQQVMSTRRGWPRRDIDNTYVGKVGAEAIDTGAIGAPKGYACVLYINGEFYGVGDFLYNSSRKDYNIAKNSPEQIMLIWDGAINIPELTDNGTWEMDSPSKPTEATAASLDRWRAFAQLGQDDFTAAIGEHLDKNNVVDFYVFLCFICAPDCVQKNTTFITWDGIKWFFMPYDLDTVFGLSWNGASISYPPTLNLFDNSLVMQVNRNFWKKVRTAYLQEMNARYAELRKSGLFSQDGVLNLARDLLGRYTPELMAAEYAKWPDVPSLNITSLDQIMSWTRQRIEYLDTFFSYKP
ncbi:spore coat protein CotH [Pluralibacter gergoviae]|uniref:CotH kinase family protein n=1 Tax=Pluralibacter gergoviae TaxID=61647 RepID=UPI00065038BE|nr:CotH kinase family protein [Pluralibacter gergoviae]KMK28646.1 spore coat protein CotH [Pluralibacter gergoviae]